MKSILRFFITSIFILSSSTAIADEFNFVTQKDPKWPKKAEWDRLKAEVDGHLTKVESVVKKSSKEDLMNPYYITNQASLTQTSGWYGAWDSKPSVYAVTPQKTEHLVAAVNFAKKHNIRLVIKSGGHSYQGTSNAADSLLVWMKDMNKYEIHKKFLCQGCEGKEEPRRAVSIQTGSRWMPVYNKVMGESDLYIQGGGCATVAAGGLISSGGFGSFSKMFGMAAAGLLEAEIVTADGKILTVNKYQNSDLFWAIRGGGGGSFGIISKVVLRAHDLPDNLGAVSMTIQAKSDKSFKNLIRSFMTFYRDKLMNPHWGESAMFTRDNKLDINMVVAALDEDQSKEVWQEFLDKINANKDYTIVKEPRFIILDGEDFFNIEYRYDKLSNSVLTDSRKNGEAKHENVFWKGNQGEVGIYLYGYDSVWLPQNLLSDKKMSHLVESLFASSRNYDIGLHFNKGLAGASETVKKEALELPINPVAVDAFALAIVADGLAGYPKATDPKFNKEKVAKNAKNLYKAVDELRKLAPNGGAYVSEADYFDKEWRTRYWGSNYKRLKAVKDKYDPEGLFTVHHGVGSEKRQK